MPSDTGFCEFMQDLYASHFLGGNGFPNRAETKISYREEINCRATKQPYPFDRSGHAGDSGDPFDFKFELFGEHC